MFSTKKIFSAIFILFFAIAPLFVLAQLNVPPITPPTETPTALPQTNVITTVDSLTNWFFAAFLIVAVWFLILAAYHFVTANGEGEKITTARNEVMYAMIGVLIAVLAKGIVSLAAGLAKQS